MSGVRVLEVWRYPVKSMQGERLDVANVTEQGIEGDRHWAIVNTETGLALTARREPRLLYAHARVTDGDAVEIRLPDGSEAYGSDELSAWLGYDVELRTPDAEQPGTYEIAVDFEDEEGSEWVSWRGPVGTFHDSGRTQVSIVSAGSLRKWDVRRFRMNLVVDAEDEDGFFGHTVQVGTAALDVAKRVSRCVITTRPQPGGIERDLDVLRTINAELDGNLGVGALVVEPGEIGVGSNVEVRRPAQKP
jgi:uncharacterized protein YcbX